MVDYPMFYRRCQNCQKYLPYFQGRTWFHPPRGVCMLVAANMDGIPYSDHRWGWDVCKDFKERAKP